jgi:Domain of unknown function (DUF4426)
MARGGKLVLIAALSCAAAGCEQNNSAGDNEELSVLAATESVQEFGDYQVHFNALTTDRLDPAVAAANNIVRSRNSVLLTISVLRKQPTGMPKGVPATVKGSATNDTGQFRNLDMREIRESDAIYYVAETSIVDAETLIFTVSATPEGASAPLTIKFQKQFFVDE